MSTAKSTHFDFSSLQTVDTGRYQEFKHVAASSLVHQSEVNAAMPLGVDLWRAECSVDLNLQIQTCQTQLRSLLKRAGLGYMKLDILGSPDQSVVDTMNALCSKIMIAVEHIESPKTEFAHLWRQVITVHIASIVIGSPNFGLTHSDESANVKQWVEEFTASSFPQACLTKTLRMKECLLAIQNNDKDGLIEEVSCNSCLNNCAELSAKLALQYWAPDPNQDDEKTFSLFTVFVGDLCVGNITPQAYGYDFSRLLVDYEKAKANIKPLPHFRDYFRPISHPLGKQLNSRQQLRHALPRTLPAPGGKGLAIPEIARVLSAFHSSILHQAAFIDQFQGKQMTDYAEAVYHNSSSLFLRNQAHEVQSAWCCDRWPFPISKL